MCLSLNALHSDKLRRILVPSGASVCGRYGRLQCKKSLALLQQVALRQKMNSAWYARLSSPPRVMLTNVAIIKGKGTMDLEYRLDALEPAMYQLGNVVVLYW
jgi:hypothetical protein